MFGHLAFDAARCQRLFETTGARSALHRRIRSASRLFCGPRRLIFVVTYTFEFLAAKGAQRQIARRFIAGVKMLMPPIFRRHHHAAFMPVVFLDRRAIGPDQRITFAAKDDHMGAGVMAMSFLVGSDGKFRNMTGGGIFRQLEFDVTPAGAALVVFQ